MCGGSPSGPDYAAMERASIADAEKIKAQAELDAMKEKDKIAQETQAQALQEQAAKEKRQQLLRVAGLGDEEDPLDPKTKSVLKEA